MQHPSVPDKQLFWFLDHPAGNKELAARVKDETLDF